MLMTFVLSPPSVLRPPVLVTRPHSLQSSPSLIDTSEKMRIDGRVSGAFNARAAADRVIAAMNLLAPDLRKFLQVCVVGKATKKSTERWAFVCAEYLRPGVDFVGDLQFLEHHWTTFFNVKLSVHGPQLRSLAVKAVVRHIDVANRSELSAEDCADAFETLSDLAVLIIADKSSRQKLRELAAGSSSLVAGTHVSGSSSGSRCEETTNKRANSVAARGGDEVDALRSTIEKHATNMEALGELCVLAMRLDDALDREASSREQASAAILQCASRHDGCLGSLTDQQQQTSEALQQVKKMAETTLSASKKATEEIADIGWEISDTRTRLCQLSSDVDGPWIRSTLGDLRFKLNRVSSDQDTKLQTLLDVLNSHAWKLRDADHMSRHMKEQLASISTKLNELDRNEDIRAIGQMQELLKLGDKIQELKSSFRFWMGLLSFVVMIAIGIAIDPPPTNLFERSRHYTSRSVSMPMRCDTDHSQRDLRMDLG